MEESERYRRGKAMRSRVLGAEHVERTIKSAGVFGEPWQRIVATEFGWGDIWSRPGLDLKIRSLCTVAVVATLARPKYLALHIKGALNVGASKEEIREVLMQVGLYAGSPAGTEAFQVAQQVFDECCREGVMQEIGK